MKGARKFTCLSLGTLGIILEMEAFGHENRGHFDHLDPGNLQLCLVALATQLGIAMDKGTFWSP